MSDDLMDDLRDFHDHCIATGNLELSELIKNSYLKMDDLESSKSGLEADNALLKTAGEDLLEAVKDSNSQLSKSTEVVSLLKSQNTRYEKHNKTLKNELNIWNESPVTEQVRVLKDKVKELEDVLSGYWVCGEHNELDEIAEKLLTTNGKG